MSAVDVSLHMPPVDTATDVAGNNPDAHFPPQPAAAPADIPGWIWNPGTNEWAPSNTPVGGGSAELGTMEPSHGDVTPARPMSRAPSEQNPYGSQDGPRMNLLDAVRNPPQASAPATQVVRHVVETQDTGTDLVRTRTVRLDSTGTVVVLEENPYRVRALIKMVTSNAVAMLFPLRQGGSGTSTTGVPTAPNAGYLIATGDPIHVSESKAGIVGQIMDTGSSSTCDVTVWEELSVPGDQPGVGV